MEPMGRVYPSTRLPCVCVGAVLTKEDKDEKRVLLLLR